MNSISPARARRSEAEPGRVDSPRVSVLPSCRTRRGHASRPSANDRRAGMTERRTRFGVIAAMVALAGISGAAAQTAATGKISNENRLFQRFIEDGAVTDGTWAEPQFRYATFDHHDVWSVGPQIAFNVAEDVELGGRIDLETLNNNPGGTETGFSDMEVYGKVRLTTKPTQFAMGALLKFPT